MEVALRKDKSCAFTLVVTDFSYSTSYIGELQSQEQTSRKCITNRLALLPVEPPILLMVLLYFSSIPTRFVDFLTTATLEWKNFPESAFLGCRKNHIPWWIRWTGDEKADFRSWLAIVKGEEKLKWEKMVKSHWTEISPLICDWVSESFQPTLIPFFAKDEQNACQPI